MKFQFKIQGYQTEAVEDTVNVFRGQPKRDPKHYRRDIGKIAKGSIFSEDEEAGYRNADVELDKKQLLDNIREMQIRNQIVPSTSLALGHGIVNLDIEMETGTGKTYVYIKTMFELNKQYAGASSSSLCRVSLYVRVSLNLSVCLKTILWSITERKHVGLSITAKDLPNLTIFQKTQVFK